MDILSSIARLRAALSPDATLEQAEGWWKLYEGLELDLEFDRHTSKYERATLQQRKDALSVATQMIRQGQPFPNVHSAGMALTALEHSIQRRTIGLDGLPLKR